MSIPLQCACGKSLQVPNEFAGKKIKCTACFQILPVPAAGGTPSLLSREPRSGGQRAIPKTTIEQPTGETPTPSDYARTRLERPSDDPPPIHARTMLERPSSETVLPAPARTKLERPPSVVPPPVHPRTMLVQPSGSPPSDPEEHSRTDWDSLSESKIPSSETRRGMIPGKRRSPAAMQAGRKKWIIGAGVVALAVLLTLGGWLVAVMLRVETATGTLVVETNDNEVDARIKGGKFIVSGPDGKSHTLTGNERSRKLDAGSYKIRVEGVNGLVLDTSEFTLTKGGKVTVRVTMEPNTVATNQPKQEEPIAPEIAPAPEATEQGLTAANVAGVWEHKPGPRPPVEITLHPNGKINDPDGDCTWTLEGMTLSLRWPNEQAPGGVWIDEVKVSEDGKTYQGTNQVRASIRGKKIRDIVP